MWTQFVSLGLQSGLYTAQQMIKTRQQIGPQMEVADVSHLISLIDSEESSSASNLI